MDEEQFGKVTAGGEDKPFCYIYWEHGFKGAVVSLYYLDIPDYIDSSIGPNSRFQVAKPNEEYREFIEQMKRAGWNQYRSQANPEVYEFWLVRFNSSDTGYEYCLLTCTYSTAENMKDRPPEFKDMYRLGADNAFMHVGKGWKTTYAEALDALDQEGWEFVRVQNYPRFEKMPYHLLQLQYFRRRAK